MAQAQTTPDPAAGASASPTKEGSKRPYPFETRANLFLLTFFLIVGAFPFPLLAQEPLRVAVTEWVTSVVLTSNDGFTLQSSSGQSFGNALYLVAEITPTHSFGLAVNGMGAPHDRLVAVPAPGRQIAVDGHPYYGYFSIEQNSDKLRVINHVHIEAYLRGVVPSEMPPGWSPEALKTQAVIARTYALYQQQTRKDEPYDLVATVASQVYKGVSVEDDRATYAILATEGQVLTYDGQIAQTFYHSTSGGRTEDAKLVWNIDLPYLKGVSCPLDRASSMYQWRRTFSGEQIEAAVRKAGYPVNAVSTLTPIRWSEAGRLLSVRILSDMGEIILSAGDIRKGIGPSKLPSTRFEIIPLENDFEIRGMGWGHGVGLCQWGARAMADSGLPYHEILAYYYPGTVLSLTH